MRYSFHGKVRASGQQVDGFVEAANATEAIDRLADRGIIGVYSVRPEPKPNKNAVYLSGEAEPPDQDPRRPSQQPRLPGKPTVVPKRIVSAPGAKQATASPAPSHVTVSSPATEAMLTQVLERLNALAARVEQALARPMSVTYQSGTVRGGGGVNLAKKSSRIPLEVQSSTLHDIFQNNLDLRKSLDKLANTVGPPAVKPALEPVASVPQGAQQSAQQSAAQGAPQGALREAASVREPVQAVRELSKPAREPAVNVQKLVAQAQPA